VIRGDPGTLLVCTLYQSTLKSKIGPKLAEPASYGQLIAFS
jgi:hypothetical protein